MMLGREEVLYLLEVQACFPQRQGWAREWSGAQVRRRGPTASCRYARDIEPRLWGS